MEVQPLSTTSSQAHSLATSTQPVAGGSPRGEVRRVSVPDTLFTPMFDAAPLKHVIDSLVGKVANLEATTSNLEDENAKLRNEVATCTHKYNVSQDQLSAMFQTVTTYNEELMSLKASSLPREEAKKTFEGINGETEAIRESILDLDNKKIDTHSSLLETRIREVADDSSNRFLLRREREQREWLTLQINTMDTKMTTTVENTKQSVQAQLDEVEGRIEKKQQEVLGEILNLAGEVKNYMGQEEGVDRSFVSKVDALERMMTELSSQIQTELDRVDNNLKKSLKSFGIDWSQLMEAITTASPPVIVEDDVDSVHIQYQRDLMSLQLQTEFALGWKHVRHANHKLLSHIPRFSRSQQQQAQSSSNAAQEQSIVGDVPDLESGRRRLDLAREDKLRAVKKQRELHSQQAAANAKANQSTATKGAISTISKFLLGTQALGDLRHLITDDYTKDIASTKTEICDDLSVQVQRIQRELRQKVGSQRAVELIEEFAAKTVNTEVLKVTKSVKDISQAVIPREELEARLNSKADKSMLEEKVDNTELSSAESALREEYSTMSEALMTRLNASVDGKIKEVEGMKLSRTDPVFIDLLETVDQMANGTHPALTVYSASPTAVPGGATSPGPKKASSSVSSPNRDGAPGTDGRCLTCGTSTTTNNATTNTASNHVAEGDLSRRPTTAPSTLPEPQQARRLQPGELATMKEGELQSMQETIHQKQMQRAKLAASSTGSSSTGGGGGISSAVALPQQGQSPRPKQLVKSSAGNGNKTATRGNFNLQDWADGVDQRHNQGQHAQVRKTVLEEQQKGSGPAADSSALGTVVGPPITADSSPPQVLQSTSTGEKVVAEQLFIKGGFTGNKTSTTTTVGGSRPMSAAPKPPHPPASGKQ